MTEYIMVTDVFNTHADAKQWLSRNHNHTRNGSKYYIVTRNYTHFIIRTVTERDMTKRSQIKVVAGLQRMITIYQSVKKNKSGIYQPRPEDVMGVENDF